MAKRSAWRGVGSEGAYPEWVRALKTASGVYAIRQGSKVVYVGESHKGSLKKTLTRHFQEWGRSSASTRKLSFMGWMFGSSTDPGRTYPRGSCTVSVQVCRADQAVELQDQWIRKMLPRDNRYGTDNDTVDF